MLKKITLTLFGLVFAVALIAPPKATAQVHIGVRIGGPSYGYVVQQSPYYVYDDPYVVYAPSGEYGYRVGYYDHDRDYRRYDDRGYWGHEGWRHHDHWDHDRGHEDWEHHEHGNWGHHDHHDWGHHDRGDD
jgi:hypothetical protein